MNLGFLVLLVIGFLAVVLLLEGGYLLWTDYRGPEVQRLEKRLRTVSQSGASFQSASLLRGRRDEDLSQIERMLLANPTAKLVDAYVRQSGIDITLLKLISLSLALFVAVFLCLLVIRVSFVPALSFSLIAAVLPAMWVVRRRSARLLAMERQLPDAVDLIARALRAGHTFSSALQMAGDELPDPIRGEFQLTFDEINYGVPMSESLMNLARRAPIDDLRFIVVAVTLQRETGGNLAELLDNIARLIRERFTLFGTIRVLSAEGRMSAWILCLLPIGTGGIVFLTNPGFLSVLWTDPMGIDLLKTAIFMMAFGVFWMTRVIKIKV